MNRASDEGLPDQPGGQGGTDADGGRGQGVQEQPAQAADGPDRAHGEALAPHLAPEDLPRRERRQQQKPPDAPLPVPRDQPLPDHLPPEAQGVALAGQQQGGEVRPDRDRPLEAARTARTAGPAKKWNGDMAASAATMSG